MSARIASPLYVFHFCFALYSNCFTLNSGKWISRIKRRTRVSYALIGRCSKRIYELKKTCFVLDFLWFQSTFGFNHHTTQKHIFRALCNKCDWNAEPPAPLPIDVSVRNSIRISDILYTCLQRSLWNIVFAAGFSVATRECLWHAMMLCLLFAGQTHLF